MPPPTYKAGDQIIVTHDPDHWLAGYGIQIGDIGTVTPNPQFHGDIFYSDCIWIKFNRPLTRPTPDGTEILGPYIQNITPNDNYALRHRARIAWKRGDHTL